MRLTDIDALFDEVYKIDHNFHSYYDPDQGIWVHDFYVSENKLMDVLRQLDYIEIPMQTTYRGKHEVKI